MMMMMDERSKGTSFPSAEAAYLRLCFTYIITRPCQSTTSVIISIRVLVRFSQRVKTQ